LRSTAAKKMSLRVTRLIAIWAGKSSVGTFVAPDKMYCFGNSFGNVEDGVDEYFRVYPQLKRRYSASVVEPNLQHREGFCDQKKRGDSIGGFVVGEHADGTSVICAK
jgi:hypothetical protein